MRNQVLRIMFACLIYSVFLNITHVNLAYVQTTVFPLEKVAQLRVEAENAEERPKQLPEGWSKSPADPAKVLAVFNSLRLKKGYVLRAYQFRDRGNGNAFVWAMPEDAPFPSPRRHALRP